LPGSENGLFGSSNGGSAWTRIGVPTSMIRYVAVSGTNLLALSSWYGHDYSYDWLISTDDGVSWNYLKEGLTNTRVVTLS